jgi:hypothetical protein
MGSDRKPCHVIWKLETLGEPRESSLKEHTNAELGFL